MSYELRAASGNTRENRAKYITPANWKWHYTVYGVLVMLQGTGDEGQVTTQYGVITVQLLNNIGVT